jgi:DNA/RNA-binding domain of Phe-tRNA-synthetase-like protein
MNLVSLESGFPISIIDLGRLEALHPGKDLCLRFGVEGERYVFNQAGHVIELAGLFGLGVDGGELIANPVKDSVPTKVGLGASSVLIVIYASRVVADEAAVREVAERFARPLGEGRVEVLGG